MRAPLSTHPIWHISNFEHIGINNIMYTPRARGDQPDENLKGISRGSKSRTAIRSLSDDLTLMAPHPSLQCL